MTGAWSGGKGSGRRKAQVPDSEVSDAWDRIFSKPGDKNQENPDLEEDPGYITSKDEG